MERESYQELLDLTQKNLPLEKSYLEHYARRSYWGHLNWKRILLLFGSLQEEFLSQLDFLLPFTPPSLFQGRMEGLYSGWANFKTIYLSSMRAGMIMHWHVCSNFLACLETPPLLVSYEHCGTSMTANTTLLYIFKNKTI